MKIIYILFIIILAISTQDQSEEAYVRVLSPFIVNFTSLMYEYFLICGEDYFCNPNQFDFVSKFETNISNICPECKCDRDCTIRADCCPDVIFSVPLPVCLSPSVKTGEKSKLKQTLMINTCKNGTDKDLYRKCLAHEVIFEVNRIQFPPVTSRRYIQTFTNKFCAECNEVFDYNEWSLALDCPEFTDFNFLSSFKELFDLANTRDCDIGFKTVKGDMEYCYHEIDIKSGCNFTGTWTKFDSDIELACNSDYTLSYGSYKNIFCFMCNPPTSAMTTRESCNATGFWYPPDNGLEQACLLHGQSQNTLPYKNVFCFACNRNNNRDSWYFDVSEEKVLEMFLEGSRKVDKAFTFIYDISFEEYNLEFFKNIFSTDRLIKPSDSTISDIIVKGKRAVNITSLLMYDYSVTGYYRYCRDIVPYRLGTYKCSCNPVCFFDISMECCIDIAIEYPISCQKIKFETTGPFLRMIDGCFRAKWTDMITSRCSSSENVHDIFFSLPVTSNYQDMQYKNFYCFVCNQKGYSSTNNTDFLQYLHYHTWNLYLECDDDLNVKFQTTIYDILATAKQKNCSIDISSFTQNSDESCEHQVPDFFGISVGSSSEECNVSGLWEEYDPDVQWACEDLQTSLYEYDGHTNVFCFICNPSVKLDSPKVIQSCNIEADHQYYGQDIITACKEAPIIQGMFPSKNIFCEYCNLNYTIPLPAPINWKMYDYLEMKAAMRFETKLKPILHDLFNPFANKQEQFESDANGTHIYDPILDKERPLTCYPGKTIIGPQCVPLLTLTNFLRYTMAMSLEGKLNISGDHREILSHIKDEIQTEIIHHLNVNFIGISSIYILANISCDVPNSNQTEPIGVHVLIHVTFLVVETVNRLSTEEILVNMTTTDFTLLNTTFESRPSKEAYVLPLIITYDYNHFCHVSVWSNLQNFLPDIHTSVVSRVMLCRQVELDASEYTLKFDTLELSIKYSSTKYYQDRYILTPDGKVQLCVEDYQDMLESYLNKSEDDMFRKALEITSYVCSVLSMFCLFLTFVTYLLFPAMRSVPGINNMNLVFTMFFSQGFFQFGILETSDHVLCKSLGVLIHYLWLAMFACMSICSFHMYSVFATNILIGRSRNSRKTIALYMLFSYGTPAVIIALNIIVMHLTSGASGVDNAGNIGYGGTLCFISNAISFYVTFLAPVIAICIINFFFFLRVAIQIKRTPNVQSTKDHKNDFLIYLKLFTITGVTWILVVVDSFVFKLSVLSFIVTFLTGCQGLFVFISFIWTRRVFRLYKVLFSEGKRRQISTINTASTRSSTAVSSSL